MENIVSQFARQLTLAEKMDLLEELKRAIAEELACAHAGDPHACPRCGSPRFVRKGRDADGSQRWLCRGCGRTFSRKTGGVLALSKLPADAWMEFARCMADALPLRETARRVGVSLYTAWFMRMRVCEVMASRTPDPRPSTFHVDETLVRGSMSGNLGRSASLELPRERHRNGQDGRRGKRGRSRDLVVVECGVSELGDCFLDAVALGAARAGELRQGLERRVPAGSVVVTDGNPGYNLPGAPWEHRVAGKGDPSAASVAMVDALHSRLRDFLRPFHGVSTRRLQRYLDWFRWVEHYKGACVDRRDLLFGHEAAGTYEGTRRRLHAEENPFVSEWMGAAAERVNGGLT